MASKDITQLKFPLNVRTRYDMYIGAANNPGVIFREAIDNSVDEILNGSADTVWIYTKKRDDGYPEYLVGDNGSGIPLREAYETLHNKKKYLDITMTKLAMENLNTGSKFNKTDIGTGRNGVGISCTVALSADFRIYSKISIQDQKSFPKSLRDRLPKDITESTYYMLRYERGNNIEESIVDLKDTDVPENMKEMLPSTLTRFVPDETIFKSLKCEVPVTTKFVKYIHPEAHFFINDIENTEVPDTYKYTIKVRAENPMKEKDILNPFVDFIVSFGVAEDFNIYSHVASVNGLDTPAGLHIKMVERSYSKAFSEFFGSCNNYEHFGVNFLNITLCNEPTFSSQTKERLTDIPDFNTWDLPQLVDAFRNIIKRNRDDFEFNFKRLQEYLKSINNMDKLTRIKSQVLVAADTARASVFVPFKLKDCAIADRTKAELFICEGDSAGGTLLQARAGLTHVAVLPLRGKPLNTVYTDVTEVLENEEISDLICSIGVGVNEYHSLDEVRFGKVIIAADSDPDGCLTGDTLVHTLKKGDIPISKLKDEFGDEPFYVWSRDEEGRQVPGLAHDPRITKTVTSLVQVTLDNDKIVECTDNHPFMLRDGSYKMASELTVGDSLMPFYFEYDYAWATGFVAKDNCIWDEEGNRYLPEYQLVHKNFIGPIIYGNQIHHLDGNHFNNDPSNLVQLTKGEHSSVELTKYNKSEEHIERIKQLHREGAYDHCYDNLVEWNRSDYHKQQVAEMNSDEDMKYSQFLGKIATILMKLEYLGLPINEENYNKYFVTSTYGYDEKYIEEARQLLEDNPWLRTKKLNQLQGKSEEELRYAPPVYQYNNLVTIGVGIVNSLIEDNIEVTDESYDERRPGRFSYKFSTLMEATNTESIPELIEFSKNYNHKVKSLKVISCDATEVWDLTVDTYHNFALASGCYVHNSNISALILGTILYHLTFLLEAGHVYIVKTPLYEQGGEYFYAGEEHLLDTNKRYRRFKGLGELNPQQLKDTALDPNKRKLIQVTVGDAARALAILSSTNARSQLLIENGLIDLKNLTYEEFMNANGN